MMTNPESGIRARFHLERSGFALDVDLDLPGKGVTALFGHSGSGKTTVLRAIAGLERVADGYLAVNGRVWQDDARGIFMPTYQRPIGYVFQEASLFAHLNIRQNLEFGQQRVPQQQRCVSLDHAIALLGIGHLLKRMPDALSGGERQRVGIARALAVSPQLLLMDEPLAALDLKLKGEILPYLERLHDELDIPLLYVSHAPDEVARLADHLVLLDHGQVLASGALSETLARLDLPLSQDDDAGVVLAGSVSGFDRQWHLCQVGFVGGNLWVRDNGATLNQSLRVRILARDVSLTLTPHTDGSILNILPAVVTELGDDQHPALTLVRLDAGGAPLLARLTRRSAAALDLHPGRAVWAQIKSVALLG